MRHIEKLRSARDRVGPELSDRQREGTLSSLDADIAALDSQLAVEHACCMDMHNTIAEMRARVANLRARGIHGGKQASSASGAES
jgi:hypothetical protein